MRNDKLKTVITLVFDTWYGTVALWILLALVLKLIKELLFRDPMSPDSLVSVAQAIHFVQLGLPLSFLCQLLFLS